MNLERPARRRPTDPDFRAIVDPARLDVVASTGLLGQIHDPQLDELVRQLASDGIAPICAVIIVDAYRQVFTSSVGLPEPWRTLREAPLARSRCQIVVATQQPLIIDDANSEPPISVPIAMVDRGINAWLGLPIVGADRMVVGVLAFMDEQPRNWLSGALRQADDGAARACATIARRIARRSATQSPPARHA